MQRPIFALLLLQFFIAGTVACAEEQSVLVDDPYIELHTGPGRGYPIFYVAERGEEVAILKRRTDWYKIRVPRGAEGWVNRDQMEQTLQLNGEEWDVPGFTLGDYAGRRWEVGALYGDFGGANVVSAYGAFSLTQNMSVEMSLSDVLGRFSNSTMFNANVVHMFFPEWRASPFFTLGAGVINTDPKGTIVATSDRTDNLAHAGAGVRMYVTRRFVFRAEYKTYVVFTSRNDNEEIREWKAGFSFFF